MASLPLTYKISQESSHTFDQRHTVSQYGDGVQQRAAVGINNRFDTWNLIFDKLNVTERATMVAFFNSHGFVKSFDWTPPNGTASKWVFTSPMNEDNEATYYTFTFSVTQVFD